LPRRMPISMMPVRGCGGCGKREKQIPFGNESQKGQGYEWWFRLLWYPGLNVETGGTRR